MPTFLHSYYPLGVNIPGYLPNESSVFSLIGQFALLWAAIVGIAWLIISRSRPDASNADHLAFVWFCFSMFDLTMKREAYLTDYSAASIHLFFEGYFVVNHVTIGGKSHLFAELWKEYSFSDSRYLRSDAFLVCMESITAVRPIWHSRAFVLSWESLVTDLLGSARVLRCLLHCRTISSAIHLTNCHFRWSTIWWCAILCHQSVRSSPSRYWVFASGELLFLGILLLHELHLDCYSFL